MTAAGRSTVSELVRPSAARLRWVQILAIAGAICGFTFAATVDLTTEGLTVTSLVLASLVCYAMVLPAWGIPRLRVATLRSVSLFVGLTLGVLLIAFISMDAARRLGSAQSTTGLPVVFPIALIVVGAAVIIGRSRSLDVRDGNALLAIQLPMLGLLLWLAGRVAPSAPTALTVLSGVGLLVVAFSAPFVAPRTPFLADEEIPSTRVGRSVMALSVAVTLLGLAAPLMFYRSVGSQVLFFATAVLPLTFFSAVQHRTGGALSPTGRGIAYGCAVLIATFIGGECASTAVALVGVIDFGLTAETFRAALVMSHVLPAGCLAIALMYWTSPRRQTWHALAPLVALHVSWITVAALAIPTAFSPSLFFGAPYSRVPGSLLVASAAASIGAVVSALRGSPSRQGDRSRAATERF